MKKIKKNYKKLGLLIFAIATLISCKKEVSNDFESNGNYAGKIPIVTTSLSPKGILKFSDQKTFERFMETVKRGEGIEQIPADFKSLKKYLEAYKTKKQQETQVTLESNSDIEMGTEEDYYYSQFSNLVPDDILPYVVNEDLQIQIGDKYYQITRIGTFEVSETSLAAFETFYTTNHDNIWESEGYQVPNETLLSDGVYQLQQGITRTEVPDEMDVMGTTESFGPIVVTPSGGTNPNAGPNIPMRLVMMSPNDGMNKSGEIRFSNGRRLVFQAYNTNYVFWRTVGIQGKVQRERRIWFVTYWSESYADQLIIGADNMDLETNYTFPTPDYLAFQQMTIPSFKGLIKIEMGNFINDYLRWDYTFPSLFGRPSFTSTDVTRLASKEINKLVNNQIDDIMTRLGNSFINTLDPSYKTRVQNNALAIANLRKQNQLTFTAARSYKHQGYSNKNFWRFDWNFMISNVGAVPYTYKLNSGNFICKARFGSDWLGIRIVQP